MIRLLSLAMLTLFCSCTTSPEPVLDRSGDVFIRVENTSDVFINGGFLQIGEQTFEFAGLGANEKSIYRSFQKTAIISYAEVELAQTTKAWQPTADVNWTPLLKGYYTIRLHTSAGSDGLIATLVED